MDIDEGYLNLALFDCVNDLKKRIWDMFMANCSDQADHISIVSQLNDAEWLNATVICGSYYIIIRCKSSDSF